MALTKKQKAFGDSLINTMGNVTIACAETGVTLPDFHKWLRENDDFRIVYDTAIQVFDDQALVALQNLIDAGDRAAVIEYMKMKRQREDMREIDKTKREVMRILIESKDTKGECLKEYCTVFKCTKNAADDQFDNVVAEYGLKTPHQRMKEKKSKKDNSLAERFESGQLTEIEMYSSMLSKALYDSENAEYPSERSKARADVISINQRLDEINERIRREAEADDQNIFDKLDAVLAGVTPNEIKDLKQKINSNRLELSDATSDS